MKPIHRALGRTALLLGVGLLAGCGRAPEAMAPSPETKAAPAAIVPATTDDARAAEEESEPRTLAEAEALLEKSRSELESLALNRSMTTISGGAPANAAPAQAPSPAPPGAQNAPKRAEKSADEQAEGSARSKDSNSCETACKAFSSLDRASSAVCRLDADGGQRCERARRIREEARLRVASCSCAQ